MLDYGLRCSRGLRGSGLVFYMFDLFFFVGLGKRVKLEIIKYEMFALIGIIIIILVVVINYDVFVIIGY